MCERAQPSASLATFAAVSTQLSFEFWEVDDDDDEELWVPRAQFRILSTESFIFGAAFVWTDVEEDEKDEEEELALALLLSSSRCRIDVSLFVLTDRRDADDESSTPADEQVVPESPDVELLLDIYPLEFIEESIWFWKYRNALALSADEDAFNYIYRL